MDSQTSFKHGENNLSMTIPTNEVNLHYFQNHFRTERHKKESVNPFRSSTVVIDFYYYRSLHALSVRLVDTSTLVQAPPSAAARIKPHSFTSQFKSQWNDEIAALVSGIQNFDRAALNWGRSLLYGPTIDKETSQAPSS